LIVMDDASFRAHFDASRLSRLEELVDLVRSGAVRDLDDPALAVELGRAEVLVTSWGAPQLCADRLAAAPRIRAVFHSAGSVRHLVSEALWGRGITVTSAADVNAIPVAEFTLAAIINAGKKAPFIANDRQAALQGWSHTHGYGDLSNYRRTIGIVGFSRIGRRVVQHLDVLDTKEVLVYDPHAEARQVTAAGARLVDLDELLTTSDILSLHAPPLPSTRQLIGARELALLHDHATLINTARGSLVDSDALAAECAAGRLYAVLDVTDPEPLPDGAPLLQVPNLVVTPHLAGSLGTEVLRLTDHTLAEIARWRAGEPLTSQVTRDALPLTA
jgi:phosphoglycerate dehydrogenase-like enzyme